MLASIVAAGTKHNSSYVESTRYVVEFEAKQEAVAWVESDGTPHFQKLQSLNNYFVQLNHKTSTAQNKEAQWCFVANTFFSGQHPAVSSRLIDTSNTIEYTLDVHLYSTRKTHFSWTRPSASAPGDDAACSHVIGKIPIRSIHRAEGAIDNAQ